MHSFENNDFNILENEAESFVEWNEVGDQFRKMDIDIHTEFNHFKRIFLEIVNKSRTSHEIQQDQKLDELLRVIKEGKGLKSDSSWFQEISYSTEFEGHFSRSCIIPSLPQDYIDRNDLLNKARDILGIGKDKFTKVILGVIGIGGIGKTVLAVSITNQSDITQLFPDGYLWASIGSDKLNEESIKPILNDWLKREGVDPIHLQNTEVKIASLNRALENKRKLLIIDDVWDVDPARALISSAGSECSIIITTRDRELPSRLGISKIIEVGKLDEDEAKKLIESRLGKPIIGRQWDENVKPFLNFIGFHALATSLAVGQIAIGDRNWKDLQVEFTNKQKEIPIDFQNPKSREESINLSLELTTNTLDAESLEKYAWLGILAMGEVFYSEDVAMLWSYFSLTQREVKNTEWMTSEREKANDLIKRFYDSPAKTTGQKR